MTQTCIFWKCFMSKESKDTKWIKLLVGSFLQVCQNFSHASMQISINRLRKIWEKNPKSGEMIRSEGS